MINKPSSERTNEMSIQDLLKLIPFDINLYENISLTSLTALVTYLLDKWEFPTSLENVAVVSHRLFPAKFGMVGWPQFPDVNRTNRSILQMRPKYRNLATSASDKGVFLSEIGVREAESLLAKFGSPRFSESTLGKNIEVPVQRGSGKARSVHPEDQIGLIRKSILFKMYSAGRFDEAEAIHLIGMLGVYDHTPSTEKRKKMKLLLQQAMTLQDQEVISFLKATSERFHKYLIK